MGPLRSAPELRDGRGEGMKLGSWCESLLLGTTHSLPHSASCNPISPPRNAIPPCTCCSVQKDSQGVSVSKRTGRVELISPPIRRPELLFSSVSCCNKHWSCTCLVWVYTAWNPIYNTCPVLPCPLPTSCGDLTASVLFALWPSTQWLPVSHCLQHLKGVYTVIHAFTC